MSWLLNLFGSMPPCRLRCTHAPLGAVDGRDAFLCSSDQKSKCDRGHGPLLQESNVPSLAAWLWVFVFAALLTVLTGCGKEQSVAPQTQVRQQHAATTQAVSPQVAAMHVDQLREAAGRALLEQRLYAPAGKNALEYYLALRANVPDDATISSALTDLMPYALSATEQSIAREDFSEAQRLHALMEQVDPKFAALPRLQRTIAEGQAALIKHRADAVAPSQEQIAPPQTLQPTQPRSDVEQAKVAQSEQQRASTRPDASTSEVTSTNTAELPPPPASSATALTVLRPLDTPSPRYPIDALRARRAGEVVVEFTVNPDGSVSNARVVRARPPRVFDRAVLDAVRRWRFAPVGEPITTRRTIGFTQE